MRRLPLSLRTLFASFLVAGLALSSGCTEDASSAKHPDAGPADTGAPPVKAEPFPHLMLVINDPPGVDHYTTDQARISVAGVASGGLVQLAYDLKAGGKTAKTGGIALAGRWTLQDLPLSPGDNVLTVRGRDAAGTVVTDTLTITHNPSLALSQVTTEPRELDPSETTPVLVTVALARGDLGSSALKLFAADKAGVVSGAALGSLNDAGQHGDVKAGDGVYSAKLTVDTSGAAGPRYYRLQAALTPAGRPAYTASSERFAVEVLQPWTAQDGVELESTMDYATQKYAAYESQKGRDAALKQLAEELAKQPGVRSAELLPDGYSVGWQMNSGFLQVFSDAPVDVKASAGGGHPGKLSAIILEPFSTHDFGKHALAEPVRKLLEGVRCPKISPVEVFIDATVTRKECRKLHEHDVIVIDSHGGVTSKDYKYGSAMVFFSTEEPLDLAAAKDRTTQTNKDGRAGRIIVVGGRKNRVGITSRFIEHYNKPFRRDTLFYLGSCSGARHPSMARAVIKNGALAYTAFTKSVSYTYAAKITKTFFDELRKGHTIIRSIITARQQHGHEDPDYKARFVSTMADDRTDIGFGVECDGYVKISQQTEHLGTKVTSTYMAAERLERHPADNSEYHIIGARRQCEFTSVSASKTVTGSGQIDEKYPTFFEWDLEKNHRVLKIELDPSRNEVMIQHFPEFAIGEESSTWVTWNVKDNNGSSTKQGNCHFGSIGPVPFGHVKTTYKDDEVTIAEDYIEGTVHYKNEYGTGTIEFYYSLIPRE